MTTELDRTFEVGDVKYALAVPSSDAVRQADWYYSKTYNEAMSRGINTQSEMLDILKSRGIIGDNYDKKLAEIQELLGDKIVEMELEVSKPRRAELAVEVASLRQDLLDWHHRVNSPMSHTCESLADNARTDYLTSAMVKSADGTKTWEDFDAFINTEDRVLAMQARMQVMLFMQGLDQDFLTKVPERKVLDDLAAEAEAEQEALDEAADVAHDEAALEAGEVVADAPADEKPSPSPRRRRRKPAAPAEE